MNRCIKCGAEKSDSEFYRRENGRLRKDCKACFILRKKANYAAKAPEKRAKQRAYYANNRDGVLYWHRKRGPQTYLCLLYTSDAADEL